MKTLRQFSVAAIFSFVLTVSALAGQISSPGVVSPPPPPPADTSTSTDITTTVILTILSLIR